MDKLHNMIAIYPEKKGQNKALWVIFITSSQTIL